MRAQTLPRKSICRVQAPFFLAPGVGSHNLAVMHTTGPRSVPSPKVTAVLGPTNTGKTFFAIERMLAHKSGMIGLPLRLLAREVYGRVSDRVGKDIVAL